MRSFGVRATAGYGEKGATGMLLRCLAAMICASGVAAAQNAVEPAPTAANATAAATPLAPQVALTSPALPPTASLSAAAQPQASSAAADAHALHSATAPDPRVTEATYQRRLTELQHALANA